MLQLVRREERPAIEALAQQLHELRISWRSDLYKHSEQLYTIERFDKAIKERQIYIAKLGSDVIGYVRIAFRSANEPGVINTKIVILDEIVVRADYRNMGIGTQIMDDVKALGKAFGCNSIQLGVYPQNDAAVAFFQKNGLTIRSIEMQMHI